MVGKKLDEAPGRALAMRKDCPWKHIQTGPYKRRSWRNLVAKNDRLLAITLPLKHPRFMQHKGGYDR
jgi:hypothetical protein